MQMSLNFFSTSNSNQIAYSIEGEGSWLVLSHSLASNMDMWKPQIPLLSQYFKILRFDTRGHGQSLATADPYTLDELAQDVFELFQYLEIKKTHWIGLSMGGMIGQTLALKFPNLFESLVLADTTSKRPENAKQMWGERIAKAKAEGMAAMVDSTLKRWFDEDFRATNFSIIQEVAHGIQSTSVSGFAGCCAAISDINNFDRLQEITCPTLIMVGERDHGTPPQMAREMKEKMPAADYYEIPKAGHISNIEQPIIFNQHLTNFYRKHRFL
jgi:3-oxoadipate enol-lactonase